MIFPTGLELDQDGGRYVWPRFSKLLPILRDTDGDESASMNGRSCFFVVAFWALRQSSNIIHLHGARRGYLWIVPGPFHSFVPPPFETVMGWVD